MDALAALGTLLALPALAGINAYATVLTVGILLRSGLLTHPVFGDPAFAVLASDPVLALAATLYVLEFLADKIPAVDHVWDLVHTFIRPPRRRRGHGHAPHEDDHPRRPDAGGVGPQDGVGRADPERARGDPRPNRDRLLTGRRHTVRISRFRATGRPHRLAA